MSDLADKLAEAIEKKSNDASSWTWKDKNGDEVKLVDMSQDELQRIFNHTNDMLFHNSDGKYGKIRVKENIRKQYNSCNTELLRRCIVYDMGLELIKSNKDLLDYINQHKKINGITNEDNIDVLFSNIPTIFSKLTVGDLLRACLDSLEPINRKLITDDFILSMGIYLTKEEKQELTEYDQNGKFIPWLTVAKERLFINPKIDLKIIPTGLTYNELRSLINLDGRTRVSTLPTVTLELLRDRILLMLENNIEYHINKWSDMRNKILKIAESKGWVLKDKYADKK